MVLNNELKRKISKAIVNDFALKQTLDAKYSQSRHATYLGLNNSVHSRALKGEIDGIIAEDGWIRIGIKLGVDLSGQDWKTAPTATFTTINAQLEYCQGTGIARFFCDDIGIGKTHAAKEYVRKTVNAVYVNCKLFQTRQPLVRAIAKEFGFQDKGRFVEVREDLINNIRALKNPIIVIDDAGYLKDEALLEIIALWDELVYSCGFYMIGEPAFKIRLEKMIVKSKLGWEAWFSRYGERIMSVTEELDGEGEIALMKRYQAQQILKANCPALDKKASEELLIDSKCNLRTLREDILKIKTQKP